jgi:hypothetical protein
MFCKDVQKQSFLPMSELLFLIRIHKKRQVGFCNPSHLGGGDRMTAVRD